MGFPIEVAKEALVAESEVESAEPEHEASTGASVAFPAEEYSPSEPLPKPIHHLNVSSLLNCV
jgi:hypothetical protein